MNQQPETKDEQRVWKKDCLFACSMFMVFGVFLFGLIAAPLWEYDQRQKIMSANATSTANAVTTQRANSTATAVAHTTEQLEYSVIDPFDNNIRGWRTANVNDEYAVASIAISTGVYEWDIQEVKQPFSNWAVFPGRSSIEDFDTYVDFKISGGSPDSVCSGFVFRMASPDWEQGAYILIVCNNSNFSIYHYKQEEWDTLSKPRYTDVFHKDDWNRLEISARGDRFTFILNNETISELADDRQPMGSLALLIEINEDRPSTVWFDNFGFQPAK